MNIGLHTILQNTHLGWTVAGTMHAPPTNVRCNLSINASVQEQLSTFWTVEEIATGKPWSNKEGLCKEHFVKYLLISNDERFVVTLPL